jgi:hypothetical protein
MIRLSVTESGQARLGGDGDAGRLPPAAFYCVSSSMYFLGAVALVNSLRLLGHAEPIFVLDYGLSTAERELLSQEATLVAAHDDTTPFLLKTVAPLAHPAEVMVLIDADIIITRPLTELIQRASRDQVLAVEHGEDRFFPKWGELLDLRRAVHRTYVSSSLVFAGGQVGRRMVRLMHEAQSRIAIERTPYAGPEPDLGALGHAFNAAVGGNPFFYADQDVLNAVLACEVSADQVEEIDRTLEAVTPFAGLRVVDATSLQCAYGDGTRPYAVHHVLASKPWLEPTIPGVYTQLLVRLLRGRDVAIRVPRRDLPLHLQPGVIAGAKRWYRGPFSARIRALRERVTRVSRSSGG